MRHDAYLPSEMLGADNCTPKVDEAFKFDFFPILALLVHSGCGLLMEYEQPARCVLRYNPANY